MNEVRGAIAAAYLLVQSVVGAANPPASSIGAERVQLAKGATSAVVKGQLKGYSDVDYLVHASAGQTIAVSLQEIEPFKLL